jgi:hypothetical protein
MYKIISALWGQGKMTGFFSAMHGVELFFKNTSLMEFKLTFCLHSEIEKRELLASLKAKRNEAQVPDKLQDLIIKYIAKNISIFKNRVENPFAHLRTFIQTIFSKLNLR